MKEETVKCTNCYNDKEFRQKCREFSYHQMKDYFKDYQERDAFKSKEGIAIALLYIAANMPNLNDEKKKPEVSQDKCPYCAGGEVTLTSEVVEDGYITLLFDPEDKSLEVRDDAESVVSCVDIENCPMCGREL